jgi:type II secretory pathway pseudopilin PulG
MEPIPPIEKASDQEWRAAGVNRLVFSRVIAFPIQNQKRQEADRMVKHHSTFRRNRAPQHRRGLSLVEVIVSTALTGLLMVASLKTVGAVIRTWDVTAEQFDATTLAQQMMSEILQQEFEDPDGGGFGIETGEGTTVRTDFDDYDEWTATPPVDKDGTAITGYTGWTRYVNVQKVEPSDPTNLRSDSSADKGLRKITVTVTDPSNNQTTMVGFRSDTGAMEQKPDEAATFVTWVGSKLQVGSNSTEVVAGPNLVNHAFDQ